MLKNELLEALDKTPEILKEMLGSIPSEILKERRVEGKWSIHEHACHIPHIQPMVTDRIRRLIEEDNPKFAPYLPGTTTPEDELIKMDMQKTLGRFTKTRREFIELCKSMPDDVWHKNGEHSNFTDYNPYILVRHLLFHDHTHMYRIEELWLAKSL